MAALRGRPRRDRRATTQGERGTPLTERTHRGSHHPRTPRRWFPARSRARDNAGPAGAAGPVFVMLAAPVISDRGDTRFNATLRDKGTPPQNAPALCFAGEEHEVVRIARSVEGVEVEGSVRTIKEILLPTARGASAVQLQRATFVCTGLFRPPPSTVQRTIGLPDRLRRVWHRLHRGQLRISGRVECPDPASEWDSPDSILHACSLSSNRGSRGAEIAPACCKGEPLSPGGPNGKPTWTVRGVVRSACTVTVFLGSRP